VSYYFEEKMIATDLIFGDCGERLKDLKDESMDLTLTSPPYANQRKKTYGGVHPDKYVEWFLPISNELFRVLKPDGTFILNIKENVVNGERHTYVLELIIEMRKQGWLWTEEFIWHKKNSFPGKWPNRFRDSWERCLQFNKNKKFNMYQDEVMVPMGEWTKKRLKRLGKNDIIRRDSNTGSGMGKNLSNWEGREMSYPTNVLHLPTESGNKGHSAAFPLSLPTWFIKLFTKKYDTVLDPFVGSGTTLLASQCLNRNSIGIEASEEYYKKLKNKLDSNVDIFKEVIT
jgi:site-specific DNA-methyltransferase (adenine-specific)